MSDIHRFDLWAGEYDKSVDIADDNDHYPFAGYKKLMNTIFETVMRLSPVKVLDIGIGTGTLASRLYEGGNEIIGIDFSGEMLNKARGKMPNAALIECDFSKGLPHNLRSASFDFIISTYALHHLTDTEKLKFIPSLLNYLKKGGSILIGDVSFYSRNDLEKCRASCGREWDDGEFYFIFTDLKNELDKYCVLTYRQFSHCSGLMEIRPLDSSNNRSGHFYGCV